MKRKLIKITLVAILTVANLWFINYMEIKSQKLRQNLECRIKIPRNG